jgi:uncharacterized protein (DUF2236 family)
MGAVTDSLGRLADAYRHRVISAATSPFGHAEYPLARSLDYRGDPGLFGPGSASWTVIGDVAAFVGGIRALLMQAAHPEVVAGVFDHSRYREDPLGRLSRTSAYVTATTYGAMPEVEAAIGIVRGSHRPIRGRSHRGKVYTAGMPVLAAWVHNALTDSFLVAHQHYGAKPLDPAGADRFVAEQTRLGRMLHADPLPETAPGLAAWLAGHPDAGLSPGMAEAVSFLKSPPLEPAQRLGYRVLFEAAVATMPPRITGILGLRPRPGAEAAGKSAVGLLRWALGSSPSWHLALVRVGAEVPDGLFKQPLPLERAGATGR